jgi:hypothetical protein
LSDLKRGASRLTHRSTTIFLDRTGLTENAEGAKRVDLPPPLTNLLQSRNHSSVRIDASSRCELLCYLIDAIRIERDVPSDLLYGRKGLFVRPDRIDGLLSSSGNVVVNCSRLYKDSKLCGPNFAPARGMRLAAQSMR